MAIAATWVLLAYRLPREPSGPRVTVWRKLRRLGAVQLVDGLVALPESGQNRERFDWLADEIVEAGGEAWTFAATPGSKAQQRALSERRADVAAQDALTLLDEAAALLESDGRPHRRTVERIRRDLRRVEDGDGLSPKDRARVRRTIDRLAMSLDVAEESTP